MRRVEPEPRKSITRYTPTNISPRVTPRALAALFLAFPEPVDLGWCRRLNLHRGWLRFSLDLGRTLRSIFRRLGDYEAISITRSHNDRYKTTILVATTGAFGAVGQLEARLLRTSGVRILGVMSQCENK